MFQRRRVSLVVLALSFGLAAGPAVSYGQNDTKKPRTRPAGPSAKDYQKSLAGGVQFLLSQQQPDGSISPKIGPAVTALSMLALMKAGRSVDDPAVAKGLAYVAKYAHEDGAIGGEKSRLPNYETCLAVQCLKEANADGRYDDLLKNAEKYLRGVPVGAAQGKDKSDVDYGGAGYGQGGRPDLSNTAFLIDALHSLGAGADDETIKEALIFVSRCQNLESEYNTTEFATKNPDGGFYYTAAAGGDSAAGDSPDGALRSYGTMTYAGLKSLIYADIGPEDVRVQAAMKWLKKNYTVENNPGMGTSGLYYYYHTFAKCLAALDEDYFVDEDGKQHDWRKELAEELFRKQRHNGGWVNDNQKWMEADPNLCTTYSILALTYCKPVAAAKK